MKKVNYAEKKNLRVSMPGPGMAFNKQFPLFVSLLSRQSDMYIHDCIVFFLMATLYTSQMNAQWNGDSSGIMWPIALLGVTAVFKESEKDETNAHIQVTLSVAQQSKSDFNECVIALRVQQ